MSLQIYNTLTRIKEKFEPLAPPLVQIYLCGPTVYDFLHVGNFRGPIFYNFMANWLEESGYKIRFVQNYTDVDDKIINRANQEGVKSEEIAHKYMEEYKKDFQSLKLRAHDLNPTVTGSMDAIVAMIKRLIDQGKAYQSGGDVNYSIEAFQDYGKLSNRRPEDLLEGVRIEKDEKKKSPLDFALWKSAKPGEPEWPSPWGPGRPGWHIECSAMVKQHLGDQIDIHGGGMDLIFPHHENEIAQSEGATGKPFAKYWVHYNMINFGGAKMSKSLGNVMKGREFIETYHPEILKYMMLSVHYRSTMDLSEDSIHQSISGLARIYSALASAEDLLGVEGPIEGKSSLSTAADKAWEEAQRAFNDDLNTAEAISKLFEVVRQFNGLVKRGQKSTPALRGHAVVLMNLVERYGKLMSLFKEPPERFLATLDDQLLKQMKLNREEVESLVEMRRQARANKDFKRSDDIRDQLAKMGISVADTPNGMEWEVTK